MDSVEDSRLVTLAMAVYGQPRMLEVWFQTLRDYSEEMLAQMELIIVDDHGTPEVEIPDDIKEMLPVQLFRVLDNIPWNQPGARNLAIEHARTKLILFVDPDMLFEPAMMEKMLIAGRDLPDRNVIRFCLRHRTGPSAGVLDISSPNTWFMHVSTFRAVKGYDEEFSGNKGWSDVQLLDVIKTGYKVHHLTELFAEFYDKAEVSDASVQTLNRDHARNKIVRVRNVKAARAMGGWLKFIKQKRANLQFKWERKM